MIGIFPLLFLIFMVLKLCGIIAWSWWLITLPLWGIPTLILVTSFSALFIYLIRRRKI